MEDYVIHVRRHLHAYPELSMQEEKTIAFIKKELNKMGVPYEIVPNGGIIGKIVGTHPGKTLILRADIDALPIQEAKENLRGEKVVVSKIAGVSHTCGHDAHSAMLLGVAQILRNLTHHLHGTVLLVFERGEEIGGGIRALMERLIAIGADGVWGIHVKNDLPSGKISVDAGPRMAAPMPFAVELIGKSGHGSRPDLAHSPIECFVDFHQRFRALLSKQLDPHLPVTFSVGEIHAGTASNVIPERLQFKGTMRFLHLEQGKQAERLFKQLLENTCTIHGCSYHFEMEPEAKNLFVDNDERCAAIAAQAVQKTLGKEALTTIKPWMASEPFAIYQAYFPGVFAFLGIQNEVKGTGADHHNSQFDVDEAVLTLGVAVTVQYVLDFLQHTEPIPYMPKVRDLNELFF